MLKGFKVGSAAVGIAFIVGLVAFLFNRVSNLKEAAQVQTGKIYELEWLLDAKENELDSLKDFGQYSAPDTIWDSIPVPYAVHDTLPPDTFYVPIPRIWGHFKIDTVVGLGLKANPLYVRVKGGVYYPEEYSSKNWLQVYQDSLDTWKPPYLPVAPRSPDKWGMGLVYIRSVSGANLGYAGDYLGASVRYKRLTFSGAYDPWRKGGIGGIGIRLFGF